MPEPVGFDERLRLHARDRGDAAAFVARDAVDDADARIHFTGSGTTGDPKVVAYAPADLAAHAASSPSMAARRVLRPPHAEYNDSKRTRPYTPWQGGTSVFADPAGDSLRSQCLRHDVSWLELSPLHGTDLVATCCAEGPLRGRVEVKIGGARVPVALRREIMRVAAARLHVSYGTTKTAFVSLAGPSMHDERESVGPPGAHATVEILRGDGSPAAKRGRSGRSGCARRGWRRATSATRRRRGAISAMAASCRGTSRRSRPGAGCASTVAWTTG